MRTQQEIQDQIDLTRDPATGNPANRYPGMSYEEGVEAALLWVNGDSEEPPMDPEGD
jgi:hypothetical protein